MKKTGHKTLRSEPPIHAESAPRIGFPIFKRAVLRREARRSVGFSERGCRDTLRKTLDAASFFLRTE
jgi:hypothetical protein